MSSAQCSRIWPQWSRGCQAIASCDRPGCHAGCILYVHPVWQRHYNPPPWQLNPAVHTPRIFRRLDPRAQGPGARQAAAGHVHPHRQPAAHHPGSDRQRRRRGAGRPRQEDQGHAARRRLGQRRGRRPRHSVRPAPRREGAGGRAGVHPPARGRQVRQGHGRRLQLLRRPARRRRVASPMRCPSGWKSRRTARARWRGWCSRPAT